jgi:hypothetical protein
MIRWAVNNFSLIFTFLSGFYPTLNMVFYLFVCLHFMICSYLFTSGGVCTILFV